MFYVNEFLVHLKNFRYSPKTIKEYGYVPKIIKKHPDINFISVATIQDGLTDVSIGKIDALIATLAVIIHTP